MAIALAVSACGSSSSSSVPSSAVATVAGNPISTRAFDHWMYVEAKGEAASSPGTPVIIPDPPNFTKCVTQVRSAIPQLAKTPAASIKKDCSQLFTSYTQQVMQFLIPAYWYQAEAHKQGITLTDAQVNKALAKAKKQQFKTASAYTAFLTESGQTASDITYRVRVNQIFEKLIDKHKSSVTAADVSNYYNSHKSNYGTPERRNLRIVLTKTQANADAAEKALRSGQSWTVVAKRYSTDPTTKDKGGVLPDVTKGQEEAALSGAAFSAPVNKLQGPIKTTFGYYLVEVTKIIPATQKSFDQVKSQVKSTLTSQAASTAQKSVEAKAQKDWKPKTFCKQQYATSSCSNYVKPKTTATTPATGATTPANGATTPSSATGSATTTSSPSATTKSGSPKKSK